MNNNQIKCPYCKEEFSIGEALDKHENEIRIKIEEENKSKIKSLKSKLEQDAKAKAVKLVDDKLKMERDKMISRARKDIEIEQKKEISQVKAELEIKHQHKIQSLQKQNERKEELNKEHLEKEKQKIKSELESKVAAEKLAIEENNAKKIKSLEIDNARLKKTAIESARKAKQGAVEHQGEVQEEVLEDFLRRNFEYDQFEPIKKGAKGADILQTVYKRDEDVGKILWESKDAVNYNKAWEEKLLSDMTETNAMFGIIVSEVMPAESKGLIQFRANGKIIICPMKWASIHSVTSILRQLVDAYFKESKSHQSLSQQKEALYKLVSSPKFRLMIQQLMNEFESEYQQLEKDKKANSRSLLVREKNLENKKKFIDTLITQIAIEADIKELIEYEKESSLD